MTIRADLGLLSAKDGVTTWLCTLVSDKSAAPEVRVLRLMPAKPGRSPNKAPTPPPSDQPAHPGLNEEGSLSVTEHDRAQSVSKPAVTGAAGSVTLRLQTKPSGQSSAFVWDLTIATRVATDKMELRVLARDPQGSFQQIGLLRGTAFPPAQVNAGTAATVRTIIKPVPRLAVGLNAAPVPTIEDGYRGLKKGSGDATNFGTSRGAADLQALLYRIFFLLDAPGTLDPVWDNEAGTSSAALALRAKSADVDVATADEVWARQVAEMLLGVPYDSPSNPYNQGRGKNEKRLGNVPFCGGSLAANSSNPLFGITFACQQLATFGILSRGEYTSKLELAAASMASVVATQMKRDGGELGKWFVSASAPREIDAKSALGTQTNPDVLSPDGLQADLTEFIKLPDYGPGAVHLFSNAAVSESPAAYAQIEAFLEQNPPDQNNRVANTSVVDKGSKFVPAFDKGKPILIGGRQCRYLLKIKIQNGLVERSQVLCFPDGQNIERDNQGAAHIGFTLRVRNGKAQFLDTGGLNAPGRDTSETQQLFPLNRKGMHGGTMDDPLGSQCRSLASPFRGVGTFGNLKPENAKRLVTHVDKVLKRARPIGIARLYILKPDTVRISSTSGQFPAVAVSQVLCAFPAKPMYDSDTSPDPDRADADPLARNYSLSRFAWSLRGLSQDFQVVWVIYVPLAPLVDRMMSAGRTNPLVGAGDEIVAQTKVVRGCTHRADGSVTFLDAEALQPLTRLEGRGFNAAKLVPFTRRFLAEDVKPPPQSPGYFDAS